MHATSIPTAIVLLAVDTIDGETILTTTCHDFEHFKRLPDVVEFGGKLHGKTGWNSDRGHAYYRENAKIARAR